MNLPRTSRQLAAVLVLAAALVGCGTSEVTAREPASPAQSPPGPTTPALPSAQPLPPGRPGRPPAPVPDPRTVNHRDPDTVSRAALAVMWTMDTTIDTSQYQAELRAAPFLDPTYLERRRQHPPRSGPGAQWIEWARHRAYTTTQLHPAADDQPEDTNTLARRQWGVTARPVGRDGWRGEPVRVTAFVTLTRTAPGQPWKVAGITVSS